MKARRSDSLAAATNLAEMARYNNAIEDFAMDSVNRLQNNLRGYDAYDTGALFNKLKQKLHFQEGEAVRISYPMPRYAMLLQHGVGRGQGAGDPGPRKPRPWFNDLWEKQNGDKQLADIVAQLQGDMRARSAADDLEKELKHTAGRGITIKL